MDREYEENNWKVTVSINKKEISNPLHHSSKVKTMSI
jgi:hypothetical protein